MSVLEEGGHWEEASSAIRVSSDFSPARVRFLLPGAVSWQHPGLKMHSGGIRVPS